MSYVLDALKKMELEKVKKTRGNGMTSIAGNLFDDDRQNRAEGGMGKIVMITITVALVTFGATWFFLKPAKQVVPSGSSAKPTVTADAAAPRPHPTIPDPLPPAVKPPANPARDSSPPSAGSAVVTPKRHNAAVQLPARGAVDPVAQNTAQELKSRTKEQKSPAVPGMAPPADIKLSGIAWQDDRHARRAVINGFLMQEGESISGARITEILQDRVRFSQSGNVFEISLAASPGISQTGR
jgi:general secretion pathway protein B